MKRSSRRHPLQGWYVISTRPLNQHGGLRRAAAASGARLFAISTLALRPLDAGADATAALACALVIATSPAAARCTAAGKRLAQRRGQQWFALGAGTAAALRRRGIAKVQRPDAGSDSEALLALPALQDVDGRSVGLLTAPGGRGLIARTLRARGASVREARVYRREQRAPSPARLAMLDSLPAPLAIALTSLEAFEPLWQALSPTQRRRLLASPCLVASDRLAEHARVLGFAIVLRAADARPASLVRALVGHAGASRIR